MQLGGLQPGRVDDLHDPSRGVVPENSYRQNVFARKAFYDIGYPLGRYLARRRGEDETRWRWLPWQPPRGRRPPKSCRRSL